MISLGGRCPPYWSDPSCLGACMAGARRLSTGSHQPAALITQNRHDPRSPATIYPREPVRALAGRMCHDGVTDEKSILRNEPISKPQFNAGRSAHGSKGPAPSGGHGTPSRSHRARAVLSYEWRTACAGGFVNPRDGAWTCRGTDVPGSDGVVCPGAGASGSDRLLCGRCPPYWFRSVLRFCCAASIRRRLPSSVMGWSLSSGRGRRGVCK